MVCVKQHRLGSLIFRGCLYRNYTKWFTFGFQIRQGMQQNIIPVPTSKLPFKAQFFAETYFRVLQSFAKIAKIRSSRKFPLIRYVSLFTHDTQEKPGHQKHAVCWKPTGMYHCSPVIRKKNQVIKSMLFAENLQVCITVHPWYAGKTRSSKACCLLKTYRYVSLFTHDTQEKPGHQKHAVCWKPAGMYHCSAMIRKKNQVIKSMLFAENLDVYISVQAMLYKKNQV